MSYIKQYPIMINTPAVPAEVTENFEDARRFVNQGVTAPDINDNSIDFPEIVKGELTMFSGPEHQFTTGPGYGIFSQGFINNNGITNTTKQEYLSEVDQGTNLPLVDRRAVTNIIVIPDSGKEIIIEHRSLVTYRCFFDVNIYTSPLPDANDILLTPQHRGTTKFWMSTDGGETYYTTSTEGRFFDEVTYSSPGFNSSWAGPTDEDPMRDIVNSDGFASNIYSKNYRRQYVMCKTFVLDPGEYKLCVVSDVHHELGLIQSQNVSIECEYVGIGIV